MAEHMPGPWSVNSDPRYCNGEPCAVWGPKGPGHGVVCNMPGYNFETNAANAHLIAAAPDLLAACVTAYMACDVYRDQSPLIDEAIEHLADAIRKARGES
jgi:hypothetical protein